MTVAVTLAASDPDVPATYSIDFRRELVQDVLLNQPYTLGAVVKAQRHSGLFYECTLGGETGSQYPIAWPRVAGERVRHGSLEWTARHPDNVSVPSIDTAVWTLPTGLTKDSQAESDGFSHVTVSGGTDGEDYEVTCRMTPTSGNAVDRTIVIPRRSL